MITNQAIDRDKENRMREYARDAAAAILVRGKAWSPKSRYDGTKRHKFQTSLTDEEAAELEAIRAAICPLMSRYAFMRLLVQEFCKVARCKVKSLERTCCW